jgi:radical SAM protein with 4Fe4S-binding SPASM domain
LTGEKPLDIGFLSLENYIRILGQFKYLDCVTLQGLGEPFLNPEIFDIIRYSKDRNLSVAITTNVSLLNKEVSRKLIKSKINSKDNVTLSIDSFNADSFEKMRPPIKFTDIMRNLETFTQICRDKVNISLHLVIANENIDNLDNYISKAASLGIKQVSFSDQNLDMASDNKDNLIIKNPKRLKTSISRAISISKEKGVKFSYYKLDSNTWTKKETKHPCWFLWSYPYITWDGYVTPCCARPFPKEFNFGNVFETDFREIWNSKKYRDFRKSFTSKAIPEICIGCPHSIL